MDGQTGLRLDDNWEIICPWAQIMVGTTMPVEVTENMIELTDEILERTKKGESRRGGKVRGKGIDLEDLEEWNVKKYFQKTINKYFATIISNHGVLRYILDDTSGSWPGPKHTNWSCLMNSMWIVSQYENEYNPLHNHANCKISAVMYLKLPEYEESRKPYKPTDGNILFVGEGGVDRYFTTSNVSINPQVGNLFLFPSSLNHQVYPFRGKGERRSVSFNVDVFSEQQMEEKRKINKIQLEQDN
jgi:hypothetical protein